MKKKITLKRPIEAHGEKLKELTLREPTLDVLEDIEITVTGDGGVKINLGDIPKALAKLADIPPSAAGKVHIADLMRIAAEMQDFLAGFLPTGKTSEET